MRRSGARHGPAVPAVPVWPLQSEASHPHGATDPIAGTPAGQCSKLPRRLLLRAARIRSLDRERGNTGVHARPWHVAARQPATYARPYGPGRVTTIASDLVHHADYLSLSRPP